MKLYDILKFTLMIFFVVATPVFLLFSLEAFIYYRTGMGFFILFFEIFWLLMFVIVLLRVED